MTRKRKIIFGILVALVGLPLMLVLAVTAFFSLLNPVFLGVSNQVSGTIVSAGQKRHYLLHVPGSYDRAKPTPLVISLHGSALWPAAQMKTSQWNQVADEHGFIVVYPSATPMAPLPFLPRLPVWRTHEPEPEAGLRDDVRFIAELIDQLQAAYTIDPTRIYANGFSNGGAMASVLSCALTDRIAAVGTVAPALDALPWSTLAGCRPVPMVQFHGTADRFAPYDGGLSWPTPRPFPSVSTWAANWARRNQCGPNPLDSVVAADVSRREYTDCADDAAVVLYTIRGGGHTWPGGKPLPEWWAGPTSRSIDASVQTWRFFREHRLQASRKAARPRDG
jgi:polyhydroxybutyrate depolymerase